MKLVSVAQMREIEKEADANGLSYEDMMENAGRELAYAVADLPYFFEEEEDIEILGLVGPGNNGGDTLVALTHLAADGWKARACPHGIFRCWPISLCSDRSSSSTT